MPPSLSFYLLVIPLVTPLSAGPSLQIQDREGCGLSKRQDVEIDPESAAPLQVRDGKIDQPGPHLEAMKLNVPSNGEIHLLTSRMKTWWIRASISREPSPAYLRVEVHKETTLVLSKYVRVR